MALCKNATPTHARTVAVTIPTVAGHCGSVSALKRITPTIANAANAEQNPIKRAFVDGE